MISAREQIFMNIADFYCEIISKLSLQIKHKRHKVDNCFGKYYFSTITVYSSRKHGEKKLKMEKNPFFANWLIFVFLQVQTEDNKFKCFIAFSPEVNLLSPALAWPGC